MYNSCIHENELFKLLQTQEGTLITANTRLMKYFQELYYKEQLRQDITVFESPAIYSYDIWLKKCWSKLHAQHASVLIENNQSHFLWETVINQQTSFFFNTEGVIEEVKKAWKLCWSWGIEITESVFSNNVDTHTFYQWASCYKKMLLEKGWIDEAMLPVVLKNLMQAQKNNTQYKEKKIILAGFDRFSSSLLACTKMFSDSEPVIYESTAKADTISKVSFLSEEEAFEVFLSWAKYLCSESDINVACVIPNLSQKRNKLERFIQRYFSEEEYNISAGHIFSDLPMIATALNMLSIRKMLDEKRKVTLQDFYFLLEGRYLGEQEEKERSIVLKEIHDTENANFSWQDLLKLLNKHQLNLAQCLERFSSDSLPKKAKPSEWKDVFQHLLMTLNWPGAYGLDSAEYQTYERWLMLLQEYQQLDLVTESVPFNQALFMLKKMASKTIFQPSKQKAHIQFLGFLEAAGLAFDYVWVMGMSAEEFPGNVQLNSFIPYQVQRQYKLPHSTHEVEYSFASQLIQHFVKGGKEVVFSYLSQRDGIKIAESSFLQPFPLMSRLFDSFCLKNEPVEVLISLEQTKDLPFLEHEKIKGGTTLIKNQALCPFRAFAKHRLKTSGFEKLTRGLGEHERGSMVHEALEIFWSEVKTHQQLMAYTVEELDKLCHVASTQTVANFCKLKPYKREKLPVELWKLETKRLKSLLKKWLEIEKQRPPFSVIAIEETTSVTLAGLTLKIRMDRIDQILDGKKIVIDYKTGMVPALSLDDERPENPQLLLYTLSDMEVKAWAFAQVKAAQPLLRGRSENETGISGISAIDWETEYLLWEKRLTDLAKEFMQGKNQPLPKKSACHSCDLHGLCRIRDFS